MSPTLLNSLSRPAAIVDAREVIVRSNAAFGRLALGRPVPLRGVSWNCAFGTRPPSAALLGHRRGTPVVLEARTADGSHVRLRVDTIPLGFARRTSWLLQVLEIQASRTHSSTPAPSGGAASPS